MERYLNRLNVILIALVGGLCVWQWSGENRADRRIEHLRQAVTADERHIAAQDQAITGANEDIDEFKKVIVEFKRKSDANDVEIRRQKARVFTLEQEEKRRSAEAGALTRALAAYKQGVAIRDGNIQLLLRQRQQLVDANQDAVRKADRAVIAYNDLATKYATLVGEYNDLAKRYQAERSPAPNAQARPAS